MHRAALVSRLERLEGQGRQGEFVQRLEAARLRAVAGEARPSRPIKDDGSPLARRLIAARERVERFREQGEQEERERAARS